MVSSEQFFKALTNNGVGYFSGVPDSLLKHICAFITDNVPSHKHVIAANEGAAVGLATGFHLATGGLPLVYMQNSGLGNVVNPVLSIADDDVYGIPMVLMIGWRGQPGLKDEPQHVKQGRVTEQMLDAMEIPYISLTGDNTDSEIVASIANICSQAKENNKPVAILIAKGMFSAYSKQSEEADSDLTMTRESAIEVILDHIGDAAVVSTTGMPSREVFEIREANGLSHERDFLTVGAMGHTSQIALGVASSAPGRQVVCIDGDGSLIMHMGSMAITGASECKNFVHIVLNNGAHDSVGGQPTVGF
jgi:phosphonopyruvate decarboxylase